VTARFTDRVAIVSGASSGIGLSVAERLGSEGTRLVILSAPNDAGDLETALTRLQKLGIEVEGLAADVADPKTASQAVALATSSFGRLDVLINNAGFGYYEDIFDTPVEHLDRTYAVCVRGTFAMSLEAAGVMVRQGGGSIVNTASTASFVGEEFQVTYNAAKAAVAALTRSLAVDLAPYGIRVNAVAPGWTDTRSTRPVIDNPDLWAKHRSRIPLDRAGSPDEIAAVHAFLASDDASYVTGQIYACDGGLMAGYRYSNWAAVPPPPEGLKIGIPSVPKNLGRPLD
jgi:3-oxoacyl-[acyl-carrier protein] reductase